MAAEPSRTLDERVCRKWQEKHSHHFLLLHPSHTIRLKQLITMYVVFKETIGHSLMLTSPIYTYLWYEEGMHNLINLSCVHDITIWTLFQHGMNWKSSIITLIRGHFAPPQNLSIWTNRYLQSIYTSTLIQERSASGRPLIHREGHIVISSNNFVIDKIIWS